LEIIEIVAPQALNHNVGVQLTLFWNQIKMGVILYIGGQNNRIQNEPLDLGGYRCSTAAYKTLSDCI
jgi:hypothetical protein